MSDEEGKREREKVERESSETEGTKKKKKKKKKEARPSKRRLPRNTRKKKNDSPRSLSSPSFLTSTIQNHIFPSLSLSLYLYPTISLEPKVFPAHQRKLLETVSSLAFLDDKTKLAARLVRMSDPDKISFVCRAYLAEATSRKVETDAGLLVRKVFFISFRFFFFKRSKEVEKTFSFSSFSPSTHPPNPLPRQFAMLHRYEQFVTRDFIAQRAVSEQERLDAAAEKAEEAAAKLAEKEAEREVRRAERAEAAAAKRQKTTAAAVS